MSDWRNQWIDWLHWRPPEVLVMVWREGWSGFIVCFPSEIPNMNENGLRWKLTGVSKQIIVRAGEG